jgi:peptidase E
MNKIEKPDVIDEMKEKFKDSWIGDPIHNWNRIAGVPLAGFDAALDYIHPHIKSELDELKIELADETLESYNKDIKKKLYESEMIYTADEIKLIKQIREETK